MIEVIPAVLPKGIGELREKVSRVKDSVKTVQFDICDGVFVPTRTWPYNGNSEDAYAEILKENEGLPFWEDVDYEFDLMIKNATEKFEEIIKLGPARIVFHLEAEDNLIKFFENLDPYYREQIKFGVAINTTTDPSLLSEVSKYISFVQCMGIEHIGKQSQPFDEKVINQISKVRELFPDKIISVDGSVNKETAPKLTKAGATRLVIGSALFNEVDIMGAISEFEML